MSVVHGKVVLWRKLQVERGKMRFNFDLNETQAEQGRSSTPKDEVEWVPLQNHPVFTSGTSPAEESPTLPAGPTNLLAWDGASRLYFWDSQKRCLNRISIRLGDPEPNSVLAASPSKVTFLSQPSFSLFFSGI